MSTGAPTPDLFASAPEVPLAERMRPRCIGEMLGQPRLAAPDAPLRRAIESGRVHSMILWGPPGCGKTTLALLIAHHAEAEFRALSAVLCGLPEVRKVLAAAAEHHARGGRTVLFVDEVHRFNKAQQDAFLPHIERGSIVFVGATTENPSFELNAALLSRCRVHVLDAADRTVLVAAMRRALEDSERGLGSLQLEVDEAQLELIAQAADGDVRRALTLLEIAAELAVDGRIAPQTLGQVLADRTRRFDKRGDDFYDQISALHKSVRSSDPDAALYWLARMLDGGADPGFLARRLTRMAVEDIGLADPRALGLAIEAWEGYDRLGSPEGDLALAQLAVYLAAAPKSNAVYLGFGEARADIAAHGSLPVPMHLRNAPTRLMKQLGHGQGYRYDHDEPEGHARGQRGLPDALLDRRYYRPTTRGIEARIAERLRQLRGEGDEDGDSAGAPSKGRA